MMLMTTKVDMKKIILALAGAAAVILALVLLLGKEDPAETTGSAQTVSGNDTRVQFLTDQGWQVVNSPKESSQVRIPEKPSDMYERYNALQKSQGYDLSKYAGKAVMRYVYEIKNFPGATEPVYATLLVYKNEIIGGDITDTSAKGTIQGFKKPGMLPSQTEPTQTQSETTVPATTGADA